MSEPQVYTDFSQYTHAQLCQMLYASQPPTVTTAAETWDSTGNALHDQANSLTTQVTSFQADWSGGAANEYKRMVTDLIGGIRKVADTAYRMRDLTYDAGDALTTARTEMPQPVDVPDVAPATVALATTPIQIPAGTSPAAVAALQQQQATAVAAVQDQQQASAAANAAHAQAVTVMRTLATSYVTVNTAIPPSPAASGAPAVGATPTTTTAGSGPSGAIDVAAVGPLTTLADTSGTTSTASAQTGGASGVMPGGLFGDMFTVGLAAASAAAFGRFGSVMPSIPGFAKRSAKKSDDEKSSGTPKLGAMGAVGAGGVGAAGLRATGLGGTPGNGAPTSSPDLSGASTQAADLANAELAGSTAATGSGTTPMMPMMPMSGAGMNSGDMGGARRIPPWLVETDDVWGESSAVAPTVIGEGPGFGALG